MSQPPPHFVELAEAEKNKILLEERYRAEVRSKLTDDKASGGFKAFVNSTFGLWLLSAIFISGAGTLYQRWQKHADEEKAVFQKRLDEEAVRGDAVSKLDVEISYRLSSALLELATIEEHINTQFASRSDDERRLLHAQATFSVLQNLNPKERAKREGLYPEYQNYTLSTLLAELRRMLPEGERDAVESSLASLASLSSSMNFGKDEAASKQAAQALFSKVILKRWQGTAFHYIDCNAETPFC